MKASIQNVLLMWLLVGLVVPAVAQAGRDGGGGNGGPQEVTGLHDLLASVEVQELLVPLVFAQLEDLHRNFPRNGLGLPTELLEDLLPVTGRKGFLSGLNYRVQKAPCISFGEESDSSAELPSTICLSTDRIMARKYGQAQMLSEISGLTVHEIAHLAKIGPEQHSQIQTLQNFVTHNIQALSVDDLVYRFQQLGNNFFQELAFGNLALNYRESFAALCTAGSMVGSAIQDAWTDINQVLDVTRFPSILGSDLEVMVDEMSYRSVLVQTRACGMKSADPFFAGINNALDTKNQVSLYDIQLNVHTTVGGFSPKVYEREWCDVGEKSCPMMKTIVLSDIAEGDREGIVSELTKVRTIYDRYYSRVKALAEQADAILETINNIDINSVE